MFRNLSDTITATVLALVLAALLIIALPRRGCAAERYWRSEAIYTIRNGGDCFSVARRLRQVYGAPQPGLDTWLVAQEIAYLSGVSAHDLLHRGRKLTVPVYRRSRRWFCGDIRNHHVAVMAGRTYRVSPALLVAIRTHENPLPSRDWYAYGVKVVRGTDLRTQAWWAARIVRRIAGHQGWSPMQPTRERVVRLGKAYAEGSESWGRCVWAHYRKAKGR